MSTQKGLEAVCMGELLIDFMGSPVGIALKDTETFLKKPGGAPANVAAGLARLGRRSAFVGMVGRDAFGEFLRETLTQEGVDLRGLKVSDAQPTTLAFVALSAKGVPSFSFYRHPGADLSLDSADIDETVFEGARVFHFGSLSLVQPPAYDATYRCLQLADTHRLFISYDPNYRPALWPDMALAIERMREPLARVDLLKVSEEELQLLSGVEDLYSGCAKLANDRLKIIVVSRGARGLFGWNAGETVDIPGEQVDVIDTTGCGDSSMAGLIARLIEQEVSLLPGESVPLGVFSEALRFANRCAAITATRMGAIPALPKRAEIVF